MKKKHYGVIGHKNLVREIDSKGIINIDNEGLNKYKMIRARQQEAEAKEKRIDKMIEEHEFVKQEVSDIKKLLLELLGRNK
jgi:hypothetical protein